VAGTIDKVTAFVVRDDRDLLLFEHSYAGIQIPAGTVEEGERPEAAALREVAEETGVTALTVRRCLGWREEKLPAGEWTIAASTRVYARPDPVSFDWGYLRRGLVVSLLRRQGGFAQVTYQEFDRVPDPQYVTMCITGWVPDDALAGMRRRHFYLLDAHARTPERWTVAADTHTFAPFWAPLCALPSIIPPQDRWLEVLAEVFPVVIGKPRI
jgi:8-oxo-dGTP pyrophosphatase MutT (NUDIX family)